MWAFNLKTIMPCGLQNSGTGGGVQKEKGGFPIPDLNGSVTSTTPTSFLWPSGSLKVGTRMLREASIIKSSPQLLESKNQDEEDKKVGKPFNTGCPCSNTKSVHLAEGKPKMLLGRRFPFYQLFSNKG